MMLIVMIGRVSHRWIDNKQVPDQLLYSSHNIQTHIPSQDKIIVHGKGQKEIFVKQLGWKEKEIVKGQIKSIQYKEMLKLISRTNEIELIIKKNPYLSINVTTDFILNRN